MNSSGSLKKLQMDWINKLRPCAAAFFAEKLGRFDTAWFHSGIYFIY